MSDSRLKTYALTAGGATALAAGTASGDIIHTSTNVTLSAGERWTFTMASATLSFSNTFRNSFAELNLRPGASAQVAGDSSGFASKLSEGEAISGNLPFRPSSYTNFIVASTKASASARGNWDAVDGDDRGFLGVEIGTGADVNYGWIDVTWTGSQAIIHGYAWESDTNTAISAGQTTSGAAAVPGAPTAVGLIGLAAGAAGIRRRRSA